VHSSKIDLNAVENRDAILRGAQMSLPCAAASIFGHDRAAAINQNSRDRLGKDGVHQY
jgi:hypothetical protein